MVVGLAVVVVYGGDGYGCEAGVRFLGLREEGVEGMVFGFGRGRVW